MSWTKTEHWEAICAMMGDAPEYYPDEQDETGIEMFSDRRLDHTGYEEFDCSLCGLPNIEDTFHKECADKENAWADAASDAAADDEAWRYLNEVW